MDRNAQTPSAASGEAPTGAWDAKAVWRERVHGGRRLLRGEPPDVRALETSAGWDPTETWRVRIHAPRNTPR
jgi:hypothetical protein